MNATITLVESEMADLSLILHPLHFAYAYALALAHSRDTPRASSNLLANFSNAPIVAPPLRGQRRSPAPCETRSFIRRVADCLHCVIQ